MINNGECDCAINGYGRLGAGGGVASLHPAKRSSNKIINEGDAEM